jgi:CubicO group peptidase (beta-lactamase class C family)
LAVLILLLGNCAGAQTTLAKSADAAVGKYARDGSFWGVVLVARHGQVLYEKAYGTADLEWSIPNTIAAKFEIASLTKQFTGMAIAQLAAAGKLKLDDPVGKYYPQAPKAWEKITIDELLTHTSGLPNNELKDFPKGIAVPYTPEELIATFRDRPLNFPPGTGWKYTNTEYYLLAYIIEKVSGESYGDFLEHHIFQPLGMKDSGFAATNAVVGRLAEGYTREEGKLRHHDYFDRSLEIGAGGVHSTAHDLLLWDQALDSGKLVPRAYLDRIFAANNKGDYGYGWFVERKDGNTREWHEGSDPGYGAFLLRRPQEGLLVVVLANLENAPVRQIAQELEKLALP